MLGIKNGMGGAYDTEYGGELRCIEDFLWRHKDRRPLGRARRRWLD